MNFAIRFCIEETHASREHIKRVTGMIMSWPKFRGTDILFHTDYFTMNIHVLVKSDNLLRLIEAIRLVMDQEDGQVHDIELSQNEFHDLMKQIGNVFREVALAGLINGEVTYLGTKITRK